MTDVLPGPERDNDYIIQSPPYSQNKDKEMKWYWWVLLLVLLGVVIIGGAIWRWEFWSGVF